MAREHCPCYSSYSPDLRCCEHWVKVDQRRSSDAGGKNIQWQNCFRYLRYSRWLQLWRSDKLRTDPLARRIGRTRTRPPRPELTMPHEMTTIGVGSVFSGWQGSVVSLGANATSAIEIGMQRTSAERRKTSAEEPLWVAAQTLIS